MWRLGRTGVIVGMLLGIFQGCVGCTAHGHIDGAAEPWMDLHHTIEAVRTDSPSLAAAISEAREALAENGTASFARKALSDCTTGIVFVWLIYPEGYSGKDRVLRGSDGAEGKVCIDLGVLYVGVLDKLGTVKVLGNMAPGDGYDPDDQVHYGGYHLTGGGSGGFRGILYLEAGPGLFSSRLPGRFGELTSKICRPSPSWYGDENVETWGTTWMGILQTWDKGQVTPAVSVMSMAREAWSDVHQADTSLPEIDRRIAWLSDLYGLIWSRGTETSVWERLKPKAGSWPLCPAGLRE